MKTKISRKAKAAGHALIVALVIGSILCITLTGYLTVVQQQTLLSARSQSWNMAITLVEAGLEEGLQHLNVNPNNLGADGWSHSGIWYYHSVTMADGNSYTVYVNDTNTFQPVVIAKANVATSTFFAKNQSSAPPWMFAAQGANSLGGTVVNRAVKVTTSRGNMFTKAMVAKHTIDMKGNNVSTDSFDSQSYLKSAWGHYKSSWYSGDNGDIASNDTIVNSINGGNANIYGHMATGPNGTATIGSNGGVGSHAWQATHNGIEPNGTEGQVWYSHDSNFTFPNTDLPYNSGSSLDGPADIGVSTSTVNSNVVNSSTYPNPPPWNGVTTNGAWTTVSAYPGPQLSLTTNNYVTNSATYPSPTPAGGVTTNYLGQYAAQSGNLPAPGSFVVPGTLVDKGNQGQHNYQWTGYTSKSYAYTATSYTYKQITGYTYNTFSTNTVWTTNHYDHVLYSKDYYVSSASALSGKTLVVGSGARLVMPNGLSMSGNDQLEISDGANLTMFVGGNSIDIGGNGVMNHNGYAGTFVVYGAPSVTSLSLNGNGEFVGILCAPNASVQMNGGGHADTDFIGALVVNDVTLNGHYSFHYDEALGRAPVNGRLLITSWDEVPPNSNLPN